MVTERQAVPGDTPAASNPAGEGQSDGLPQQTINEDSTRAPAGAEKCL
jgi:hypothetical protein